MGGRKKADADCARENSSAADDLYAVMGVAKDATSAEITKAYYKLARSCHPDKSDAPESKAMFQAVGRAYAVLKDPTARELYDKTGIVTGEEGSGLNREGKEWDAVFREMFRQVSTDEIARLAKEYQGSQEELDDLKATYTKCKGSMAKILDDMMFCTYEDEVRFANAIRQMIDANEVKKFAAFANESESSRNKRVKRAQQEASEAEALASELGIGGKVAQGRDSMALIETKIKTKQQQQFDSLTAALEAKYCKPTGKQGSKAAAKAGKGAPALPTDEEFERMRAEIDARKTKK